MLGLKRKQAMALYIGHTAYQAVKGRDVAKQAITLLRAEVHDADPQTLNAENLGMALLSHGQLVAASVFYGKHSTVDPSRGIFYLADLAVVPQARGRGIARALIQLTLAELDPGDLLCGHCPSPLAGLLSAAGLTVLPPGQPLESPVLGGAGMNYLPQRPQWFYQQI